MTCAKIASKTKRKLLQQPLPQQQSERVEKDKQLSLPLIIEPANIPNLRDYQIQVISELYKRINKNHRRILIVAPTGAGKTVIAGDFIYREYSSGKTILFIVHRDVLIKQTIKKFNDFGIECGVIAGGYSENRNAPVQIASAQTLSRRKINWFTPDIIFIDEAHQTAWNKVIQKQLEECRMQNAECRRNGDILPSPFIPTIAQTPSPLEEGQQQKADSPIFIGLTATPWRLSKREAMSDLFDTLIAAPTPGELILKGYLAPPVYYSVDGIDLKGVRTVAGDFNNSDLGIRCNTPEVINTIVKEWKRLANNRLTIAFAVNIAHAKAIATAFNQAGVQAASVDGTMPTLAREIIYSQLQSGQIKVVASCEALGEGFDIPAISCVLLCRPSKSKAKAWQQIGRGLRISPGKYDCLILDQAGIVRRFGFVEDLKSFTLGKSDKTPLGQAPTKICPKCSAINRNFDALCGCCGYEYPVTPKLLPTKEFKLLRCTADKVKQYQHYHELLKEAYHRGLKPVWADNQYYSQYKQWPPYKWMRDAIFGQKPTLADKIAYRQYLIRLMVADRQAIGWVNHHMRMIFGEEYSME
ncbi:MAG: DEAD/DEAH box helicase [Okeania sp. SIO2F4]|uniref:DEAD/DEAH box helicase n=1 Tax=Okeania sp. SIO2F4 TaxID=2607790 RepID=UPI00142CC1BC|nr:DEAD/DEAH box helicase [Okeania sp. SIO2F4]NES01712.1 DEAD/DEAH box helicase [Okeania sp. SIO2F4]